MGARYPLHVHPRQNPGDKRRTYVDEGQQGKQPAGDIFLVDEVADQGAAEHRQHVKPFRRGNHHELGQLVPHQHEPVDAGNIYQPDQGNARNPRKPAEATIAVVGKMPQ